MPSALQSHRGTRALAEAWDDLADRTRAPAYARPGWFDAWWRAFGAGRPEIQALVRDGRLAAVLPLRRRRNAVSSITNWHSPAFAAAAADDDALRELYERLFARLREPLSLWFVIAGAADFETARATACSSGHRVLSRTLEHSPYVPITQPWDEYLAGRERTLRSELRRRRRRLEEQGRLAFEFHDGGERLDELLEAGFAVEGSGWKDEQGSSIATDPAARTLYCELARWAARRGVLRLAFLTLDGRPLAFQYLLWESGGAHLLKGGFEPAYRRYAPGMLLIQHVLERAFADGLESFEFGGRAEEFKLAWTSELRERMLLQVFPRTAAASAAWLAHAYGRPIAKRVKDLATARP